MTSLLRPKSPVTDFSSAAISSPSAEPSPSAPEPGNISSSGSSVGAHTRILFGPNATGQVPNSQRRPGNNHVSTTKYELWNIIPKNLLEQFRRAANLWFLIVSIFQMMPLQLSPTSKYATITPLACVLFVTFCKDAYEDYGRRRDDSRVNNRRCTLVDSSAVNSSKMMEVRWKDVNVGTYVQLQNNEPVPADMVVLACAGEEGVAYVDTAQLDGETSLKPKFALQETMRITTSKELLALEGHVFAEPPNQLMGSFNGTLFLRGFPRGVPMDAKNFLLRGSTLRNSAWVYGLVVYTGYDTKLVQNLKKTPSKRSRVEVTANYLLLIVFGCLVAAALFSAVARAIFLRNGTDGAKNMNWVWPETDPLQDNQYLAFITFMIGYNNLIPISLYVTCDLVRTFQAFLMERDHTMYHAETDSGCRVRNSGLNENLGQVEFVLTDKTGTLTENHMQFKACSIQGRFYGNWDEERGSTDEIVEMPPQHICTPLDGAPLQKMVREGLSSRVPSVIDAEEETIIDHFFLNLATCHTAMVERCVKKGEEQQSGSCRPSTLRSPQVIRSASGLLARKGEKRDTSKSSEVAPDLLGKGAEEPSFDTAPTIEIGRNERHKIVGSGEGSNDPKEASKEAAEARAKLVKEASEIKFRSPSPDEEALVAAARDYGFYFRKKVANGITVNVRGQDQYYNLLVTNEFSSDRKRMSVLVRQCDSMPTTRKTTSSCLPFDSGARCCGLAEDTEFGAQGLQGSNSFTPSKYPTVLYIKGADNVMLERLSKNDKEVTRVAKKHLQNFSKQGLRTLVLAKRELTDNEAHYFVQKMQEAETAFMNREVMKEKVADELERDLEILGVTAIEDQIQQGVPDTVNVMLRAGIKVWMLTGDNMETAVNIGIACKLIEPMMQQYKLEPGVGCLENVNAKTVLSLLEEFYRHISRAMKAERTVGEYKYCLVLHGKVLYTILEEGQAHLRQLFLAIACSSASVIACRLAPAQKAALVKLVRNNVVGSPLTLAIGDGGNDVSMIQEAHVGVGVLGVEGRQAANAADYVIAQFRFLQPMVFVHGRWNLRRIGIVIGYSFYKNFLLVLPLALYANYTGFIGTTLYESYLLTSFNLVFTSLPIFIVGVFDVDVSAKMALLVPSLYQMGIQKRYFNARMLIGWIVRGVFHAVLTFITMQALFTGSVADSSVPGGHMVDYLVMGSWAYWACITVANLTMMLHTKAWMDWQVLMVIGSSLIFVPLLWCYSDGDFFMAPALNPDMVGVAPNLFGHVRSWMGLLLVAAACSLSDLAVSFAKKEMAPDAADILQEVELGRVAGIECPPDASREERQALAIDYLSKLPPPPRKVMKLKPEDRLSLKPFPSPTKRKQTSRSPVSVVPVTENLEEADRRYDDEPYIVSVPQSYCERISNTFNETTNRLWRMQWTEVTVGEICGNLRFGEIEISSHFLTAVRQANSAVGYHSERGLGIVRRCDIVGTRSLESGSAENSPSLDPSNSKASSKGRSDSSCLMGEGSQHPPHTTNVPNELMESKEVIKDLQYSIFTLRFSSKPHENAFANFLCTQAVQLFRKSLMSFFVVLMLYNSYQLLRRPAYGTVIRVAVWVGVLPCGALAHSFLRTGVFLRRAEPLITTAIVVFISMKHAYDILVASHGLLMNSYLPLFISAGTRIRFPYLVFVYLFHVVVMTLRYWFLAGTSIAGGGIDAVGMGDTLAAACFVLMLGVATLRSYYGYQLEKVMRKDFFVLDSIRRSKHHCMEILKNLFPENVVENVVQQIGLNPRGMQGLPRGTFPPKFKMDRAVREDRGIVTVLFCDICDFDGLVEIIQPFELVQFLDLVWMMFDGICGLHGVMKIETVGKTYMAAAMRKEPSKANAASQAADAANVVFTAIGMLELVRGRFTGTGRVTKISVRVGVHTGPAISGVVGSQRPQFALFGDTVNTAARMQSTGRRNLLHISGATHDVLQGDRRFTWEARQTQVKGKGTMTTYLLKRWNESGDTTRQDQRKHSVGDVKPPPKGVGSPVAPTDSPSILSPSLPGIPTLSTSDTGNYGTASAESMAGFAETEDGERASVDGDGGRDFSMTHDTFSPDTEVASEGRQPQRALEPGGFHDLSEQVQNDEENPAEPEVVDNSCSARLWKMVKKKWGEMGLSEKTAQDMTGPPIMSMWVSYVSFLVTFAAESIPHIASRENHHDLWLFETFMRLSYCVIGTIGAVLLFRAGRQLKWGAKDSKLLPAYSDVIATLVFIGFIFTFVANTQNFARSGSRFWIVFEGFFFVMVLTHLCQLHPQGVVAVLLCILVVVAILTWVALKDGELLPECVSYTVFVFGTHIVAVLGDPRWDLKDHKAIYEDNERANSLLCSVLPREVLTEMKVGNLSLAYQYEDMTFIFADIVGFTRYCSEHTAEEAVNLVTRLFAEFDRQAAWLGVYKVCTIGDAYVGVNEPRMKVEDQLGDCENVFKMAMHVLECIGRVRDEVKHPDLDMRIGLHYGKFVGGVIGTQCLRFDIWGEDVLIGNNIESHGRPGIICVSEAAKEVLEQTNVMPLEFIFHDDIKLKNGKVIRSYACKLQPE